MIIFLLCSSLECYQILVFTKPFVRSACQWTHGSIYTKCSCMELTLPCTGSGNYYEEERDKSKRCISIRVNSCGENPSASFVTSIRRSNNWMDCKMFSGRWWWSGLSSPRWRQRVLLLVVTSGGSFGRGGKTRTRFADVAKWNDPARRKVHFQLISAL